MEQEENFKQTKKRQLKVYEKHISRAYHRYVIFPEIRLCGKWLQEIGFGCGQYVVVHQKKKKITITVDNSNIEVEKKH